MSKKDFLIEVSEGSAPSTYLLYKEKLNDIQTRETRAIEVYSGVVLHIAVYQMEKDRVTDNNSPVVSETSTYIPGGVVSYDEKKEIIIIDHPESSRA